MSDQHHDEIGTVIACFCLFLLALAVYVTFTSPGKSEEKHIGQNQQTVWVMGMVNTQELNVHSNPGVNSPVIAQLGKGARLTYAEVPVSVGNDLWVRISADNGRIQGWASKQYINTLF